MKKTGGSKKQPPRGKTVSEEDAKAIARRLREFSKRFASWGAFARKLGIPRTTGRYWIAEDGPSVPETQYLLRFAREANLNLNWLLLGEGPATREQVTRTPEGGVLAAIDAELRATEDGHDYEKDQAWYMLANYSTNASPPEGAFQLALNALRPLYRQFIQRVRDFKAQTHNLVQVHKAAMAELLAYKKLEPAVAKRILEELTAKVRSQSPTMPPLHVTTSVVIEAPPQREGQP